MVPLVTSFLVMEHMQSEEVKLGILPLSTLSLFRATNLAEKQKRIHILRPFTRAIHGIIGTKRCRGNRLESDPRTLSGSTCPLAPDGPPHPRSIRRPFHHCLSSLPALHWPLCGTTWLLWRRIFSCPHVVDQTEFPLDDVSLRMGEQAGTGGRPCDTNQQIQLR